MLKVLAFRKTAKYGMTLKCMIAAVERMETVYFSDLNSFLPSKMVQFAKFFYAAVHYSPVEVHQHFGRTYGLHFHC
jgi:hypothetical protein